MDHESSTTEERLLEIGGAARVLGLSPSGVRRLVTIGRLEVLARSERGLLLFARGTVEALRAKRAADPPRPGRPRRSEGAAA
jgi:hypothetical protein